MFFIVGQKDKDCYVLYDSVNGGRACASLYTIKQIIDNGVEVIGARLTPDGRLTTKGIQIVNTNGQPVIRLNRFDDVPDTKRSASTFLKGIKRTKEEINRAKSIGEKRSQTIQEKKANVDPRQFDALNLYKDIVANGREIKRLTPQKVCAIYNYEKLTEDRVYDFEQVYDSNGKPLPGYYSKSKDILYSRKKCLEAYARQLDSLGLDENGFVNYSFYSKDYGKTPKEIILYVLQTTKKPIRYTYGLKYRNPTTRDVPKTNAEAVKICKSESMIDVKEFADYIDMNAYSGNDMW